MLLTKKFWKDVLIGTIFIFAFMWFASKFLTIFNFLDPIGDALGDMKITDMPEWDFWAQLYLLWAYGN